MNEQTTFDQKIDTSGLSCPLPILKAKKALATLTSGQVLKVITTDKHALHDFKVFAEQTHNQLVQQQSFGDHDWHFLKKR